MANLTQLKILEGLDGFLLVDKPVNIPFASVVKTVKRMFGLVKVGHGGSLDAQSSGLMVLLIGDANKFTDQVMSGDREYEGTLDFSYVTNTGDAQGEKCGSRSVECGDKCGSRSVECGVKEDKDFNNPSLLTPNSSLHTSVTPNSSLLTKYKGDVFQTEPKFAAIRKEGTAEYEVVDTGEHKQFLGHVYKIELGTRSEKLGVAEVPFFLKATKSVLPRALALDMGATLTSLRRVKQWKFELKDAVPFDKILNTSPADFASLVLPISAALRA